MCWQESRPIPPTALSQRQRSPPLQKRISLIGPNLKTAIVDWASSSRSHLLSPIRPFAPTARQGVIAEQLNAQTACSEQLSVGATRGAIEKERKWQESVFGVSGFFRGPVHSSGVMAQVAGHLFIGRLKPWTGRHWSGRLLCGGWFLSDDPYLPHWEWPAACGQDIPANPKGRPGDPNTQSAPLTACLSHQAPTPYRHLHQPFAPFDPVSRWADSGRMGLRVRTPGFEFGLIHSKGEPPWDPSTNRIWSDICLLKVLTNQMFLMKNMLYIHLPTIISYIM